jgi:hypothetical protein
VARAGRVKGIHPKESLRVNAQRVVETRLNEFLGWRHALADQSLIQDLHDMRIAAKRLRYALEIFDVCFPDVKPVLRDLTEIQDALGSIHDLDVLIDLLRARLVDLNRDYESGARDIMRSNASAGEKNQALRKMLLAQARDPHRLGLVGLIGDKAVQREREYADLQRRWSGPLLDEFRLRLLLVTGLETDQQHRVHPLETHDTPRRAETDGHGKSELIRPAKPVRDSSISSDGSEEEKES